jgi:hypothetical protein
MKAMLNETFLAVACIMGFPFLEFGEYIQLCGLKLERMNFQGRILITFDADRQ